MEVQRNASDPQGALTKSRTPECGKRRWPLVYYAKSRWIMPDLLSKRKPSSPTAAAAGARQMGADSWRRRSGRTSWLLSADHNYCYRRTCSPSRQRHTLTVILAGVPECNFQIVSTTKKLFTPTDKSITKQTKDSKKPWDTEYNWTKMLWCFDNLRRKGQMNHWVYSLLMYPTQTSLEIYTTCQFYLQYYNLQYLPSTTNSKELLINQL